MNEIQKVVDDLVREHFQVPTRGPSGTHKFASGLRIEEELCV